MKVFRALGRGAAFAGKYLAAVLLMLVIAAAQAPGVLWFVTAATPGCDEPGIGSLTLAAKIGLGALGVASAAIAVILGVRFLRLRWGWLLWWVVPLLSLAAPGGVLYLFPRLLDDTGGLFCH